MAVIVSHDRPPDFRHRFFTPKWTVVIVLADQVQKSGHDQPSESFRYAARFLAGKMDVIFCRNVIIYFDLTGKKKVVETFHQRLQPEGFLLLGHSESLMNITMAFRLRHFKHDMVYQKTGCCRRRGDDRMPVRIESRVLVIDDSAFNRRTIVKMLEAMPNVEVVGLCLRRRRRDAQGH